MSLVFYDDSPVFGGHEVMALSGLEALLDAYPSRVTFFVSKANVTLLEHLNGLSHKHGHLVIELVDWNSSKLEAIRNILQPSRIAKLSLMLAQANASLVVSIQGNIEHSSLSLYACKQANIRCISYIPVPHSNHVMGAKMGWLRDMFAKRIFLLPSAFITISEEMKRLLIERGAEAPVKIVYNGIDTARFNSGNCGHARAELNLPQDKVLVGIVGRVEFRQKQQHLLVKAVSSDPELLEKCHLVFAGDGPDAGHLKKVLDEEVISYSIFPWCDTAPLYKALNAIVIPSRYEGLPLVMLEALSSGTTVFGSDRDGMRDVLPEKWRFTDSDATQLSKLLKEWIANGCSGPKRALIERVRSEMSQQEFRKSFVEEILRGLVN